MAKSFKTAKTIKLFLDECSEYLDTLNQDLVSLEGGDTDDELIKRISRNLHTLKGSSAMLEFMDVSEISHATEDVLDLLKKKLPEVDKSLVNQIFENVDKITALMTTIKDGTYGGGEGAEAAPAAAAAAATSAPAQAAPAPPPPPPPAPEPAAPAPAPPPPPPPPAPKQEPPKQQQPPAPAAPPQPARAFRTGRINMFELFGAPLRGALDRCFSVFGEIESKFVLADDNIDKLDFFRSLLDLVSYLYNSLVCLGEPRINELLSRIAMMLERVVQEDIPKSSEIFDIVFTGTSAVKAIIENYTAETPSTDVVDIKNIIQRIELSLAILKDQRDYMTLESAREIFDRFEVDRDTAKSLTPYEKFNIAHSMVDGLNIFDLEVKHKESEKEDLVSMSDFFKPLTDTGRFIGCMIWLKDDGGKVAEVHFHLYYGSEQSAEDFNKTYKYLSKLENLTKTQISLSGRQKEAPKAAVAVVAAAPDVAPAAPPAGVALPPAIAAAAPEIAPQRSQPATAQQKKKAAAGPKGKEASATTVRVDTNKLDVLVNLIAELVINHNKMEGEIKLLKQNLNRIGDILDVVKMVRKSQDLTERNITLNDLLEPVRSMSGAEIPGVEQMKPVSISDFKSLRTIQDNMVQLFDMELEKDQALYSVHQNVTELKTNMDALFGEFQNDGLNIGRVIEELQDETMKLRMLPISGVFSKFPRRVRDMAKNLGKSIDFLMEGEDTELDKTLIEEIEEPLLHIIRNAIDHGVETSESRRMAGKSETGTIWARAYHEGNSVVVEVEDNGGGIDPVRVKQKALEKRLISKEEADSMDDKAAVNLIFAPGFSTAKEVTDLSGRGVGMDVVKTSIAKLKGMVDVQTAVGQGTKFKLKLPLTLAIIQAMIVKSHGYKFVIPMDPIESTERITAYDISSVEGKEVYRYQDMIIPLVKLRDVFSQPEDREMHTSYSIVIVGMGEKRLGIIVDEVIEKLQIVIKNLGDFLGDVKHISGATIFGDGTVALILDVGAILNSVSYIARRVDRKDSRLEAADEKVILLVDDSLSGRIAQREMLERMGFQVDVAASGIQALTMMAEKTYDMIVTDINMPRMDGYELTQRIRSMESTRKIPVVMVTSDVKKADRNKAYESGVNDFLAKPFSEEELKAAIEKHLRVY